MSLKFEIELKDGKLSSGELDELCTLGFNLENGILCEQDKAKALELYKYASDHGSVKGANNFGYLLSTLSTNREMVMVALSHLGRAARSGNTRAMVNIGNIFEFDQFSEEPDYKEAAKWYHRAALLGDEIGQFNYAIFLHDGRGVRRDRETAFMIFKKLSEAGIKGAHFYMGLYFENGFFVKKDYNEALRYYQLGASVNDAACYNQLGRMYNLGLGLSQKEEKMGFFYYEQAAKLGDVLALVNLAHSYELGRGVKQDRFKAMALYEKAVEAGEERAKESLERIRDELLKQKEKAPDKNTKTAPKEKSE